MCVLLKGGRVFQSIPRLLGVIGKGKTVAHRKQTLPTAEVEKIQSIDRFHKPNLELAHQVGSLPNFPRTHLRE